MRILFVFLVVCLGSAGRMMAQTDGIQTLQAQFDAYRTRGMQEKIFVHTDKPNYLAGEILWFKIYCVDAATHQPLGLSKICYVDVLDKDDRFVLQAKIALNQAEGKGSFYLPLTLNSGNYKLRAYTNWMKNSGPDYFFEQPVTIVNTLKELPAQPGLPVDSSATGSSASAGDTASGVRDGSSIAFFPEGGNLVQGIPSVIAFQLTDGQGWGQEGKGVIVDEHNDSLVSFEPLRAGIGRFTWTPAAGHQYKALVRFPGGAVLKKELPTVYEQGYTMHADEGSDGSLKVTVHALSPFSKEVYLFGRSGTSFRLTRSGVLSGDSTAFLIAGDSLGEGITQLTLFDGNLRPVCERLTFRRPAQHMSINVSSDKEQYDTRGKITLALSVSDMDRIRIKGEGAEPPASLSMAVYRLDSLSASSGMDLMNYLWMGSDLRGRIESPDYYFTASGPEADQALDNLMLTHGWRRFRWEEQHGNKPPVFAFPPEYSGHIVTGKLTDMHTGLPLAHRIASLSVPGIDYRFQSAMTDSSGKMVFDINDFYGQEGIVIRSGLSVDSPGKVDIFSPFSEQYGGDRLPPFALSNDARQSLLDRSLHMQVQNIYSGDSLLRFRSPSQDSLPFYSNRAHKYMLDDYTRFTTTEEVLREYVHEVNVNHLHGHLHELVLDEPAREFFDDDNTLTLLDGIPVPDDKIFLYDPLKMKKLEVVARRYFQGPVSFSGIASFTTYKGDYEGLELDRHCTLLDYEGLQWRREFYSPQYETEERRHDHIPDFRNLLFWSPDVHIRGQEKNEYSFYTSDVPGTYLIVVQGLATDGRVGYKEMTFEVK